MRRHLFAVLSLTVLAGCAGQGRLLSVSLPSGRLPDAPAGVNAPPVPLVSGVGGWKPYGIAQVKNSLEIGRDVPETGCLTLSGKDGASGAYAQTDWLPGDSPVLSWDWSLAGRRLREEPVALIVGFAVDENMAAPTTRAWADAVERALSVRPPVRAIAYVFGSAANDGVATTSFFAPADVWTVALRSPASADGAWRHEVRDVRRDYEAIFGEAPPRVTGVAFVGDARGEGVSLKSSVKNLAAAPMPVAAEMGSFGRDPEAQFPAWFWWTLGGCLAFCVVSGVWLAVRISRRLFGAAAAELAAGSAAVSARPPEHGPPSGSGP
jgi:hypothetical protein